jgi:hypothetical protein
MTNSIAFMLYMLLCVASLSTVPVLRKRFHPVELILGYVFIVILVQQTFTIMGLNLKMFEMANGLQAFLSIKLPGLFYYPVVYLWLIYFLLSVEVKFWSKPFIFGAFIVLLLVSDLTTVISGFIIEHHSNLVYSLIRHSGLILIAALFLAWVRNQLDKEGAHR